MLTAFALTPLGLVVLCAAIVFLWGVTHGKHRGRRGAIRHWGLAAITVGGAAFIGHELLHTYTITNETLQGRRVTIVHVDGTLLPECELAPGARCARWALMRLRGESYFPVIVDGVSSECGVYVHADPGSPHAAVLRESGGGVRCEEAR